MRIAGNVLAVLLMLVGCVWFFQGIGVLPGSFMSGQSRWAINGGIAFVVGVVLFVIVRRARRAGSLSRSIASIIPGSFATDFR